jgi:glycosyltransferase involved in cell wall biosynthesis
MRFAVVLPHREVFGPDGAGAVAMVVRRLVSAPSRHPALVIGRAFEGEAFPGLDFLPVQVPGWLPLNPTQGYALAVSRAIDELPPGPIEVHNKPDVARWLARSYPRLPVTLFLHNDPRTMRGARSAWSRLRLLEHLSAVVTVSSFVRDAFLEGLDPPARRVPLVIHNFVDAAALPPPLPAEQREALILFAGRVVPEKAPDAFVAACARALPQLPGWRAVVVGADGFSPNSPETVFTRRLRPLAASAGVELAGYRPHEEVLQMMARVAIVVVPSRWQEPFGLTALEAMASGAALVCSRRGGLKEVAGDACLPFDPDDAEQGAAALVRLARDHALRAALSRAGLQRAAAHFGAEEATARLDRLRDRLLAAWTPSRRGKR